MNPHKNERGYFIVGIGILLILVALLLVAYVYTHPPIEPPPQMYPSHSVMPVSLTQSVLEQIEQ